MKQIKYDFEITGDIGYGFGSKGYVAQKLNENKGKHVDIRVNSLGGSVDDALDIVARLQEHGNATVHLKGMNASAATILAMGAKRVVMDRNGLMLIHNCLAVVWELGWMNANEIQEAMERMKKQSEDQAVIDRVIASIYSNRCGKPFDEIKEVMDRGGWLSAEDCLELGLIDEIAEVEQQDRRTAAVARASFSELQLAYGLPNLPSQTINDQVQDALDNLNIKMKNLLNTIFALFGMNEIEDNASEEQMQTALDGVTAKMNENKAALDAAVADKQKAEEALATANADHEKAMDDANKQIADLKAQLEALQAAPGADPQEPQAGNEPQNVEFLDGKSAVDIYNML